MPAELINFFNPKNIAVVGASNIENKVGNIVFKNILQSEFKGKVYPVNISEDTVLGNKSYKSVLDIDKEIDLVLVAIPAAATLLIVEDLAKNGYKNFVLYAAGFSEVGEEGKLLDKKLKYLIKKFDLNILGPNCFGFINNNLSLNTTFAKAPKNLGKIKFISQSGAIASSFFDYSNSYKLGISEFISIGNKSSINETDILEYFLENSMENESFSIGLYLESITNGKKFVNIIKKLSEKHKIFILKPGKTQVSQKAMMSHTASLAGDDDVFESVINDLGIIRAQTLEEFFDLATYLSDQKIPQSNSITIITNAGGPGVVATDFAKLNNVSLDIYSKELLSILKNSLPSGASYSNPIDLIGDAKADRFQTICDIYKNTDYENFLFIITPQLATQISETIQIIVKFKRSGKNIFVSLIGGEAFWEAKSHLLQNSIPVISYPERALNVFAKVTNSQLIKNNPTLNQILIESKPSHTLLDPILSNKLLKKYKIKTPKTFYLTSSDISGLKFPLILKLTSPQILHKNNLGGISNIINSKKDLLSEVKKLKINQEKLLKNGFTNVKIIAQEVITGGVEVIVGNRDDASFGDYLFFSVGGYLADISTEKNILIGPVSKQKLLNKISKSNLGKILQKNNFNYEDLANEFIKFAQIKVENKFIKEIEINPIIINEKGIWAIDPKVILLNNRDDE